MRDGPPRPPVGWSGWIPGDDHWNHRPSACADPHIDVPHVGDPIDHPSRLPLETLRVRLAAAQFECRPLLDFTAGVLAREVEHTSVISFGLSQYPTAIVEERQFRIRMPHITSRGILYVDEEHSMRRGMPVAVRERRSDEQQGNSCDSCTNTSKPHDQLIRRQLRTDARTRASAPTIALDSRPSVAVSSPVAPAPWHVNLKLR